MSISTKRGDDGHTDLMFGRRVSKTDPRVEACGAIDELNAAIGVARVASGQELVRSSLAAIQDELIVVMGELMTLEEDRERYFKGGYKAVDGGMVDGLTSRVDQLEKAQARGKDRARGWATPGRSGSLAAAHLDVCRTICRRAEREVARVAERKLLTNPEILRYLNRLSDVIWLLARREE